MSTTARTNKQADKFREMAERLQKEIDHRRGNRRENTPKQQREATAARIEANHFERVQQALRVMADAHDAGTFPGFLELVKSKAQLLQLLKTRLDTSRGYYSIIDTGEYSDQSVLAVNFRAWLEQMTDSPEARAAKAERARLDRIKELEQSVKFSDIPGFFPTPLPLVHEMLDHALIDNSHAVLEPSAGKGDIADELVKLSNRVDLVERHHSLTAILGAKGHNPRTMDFMGFAPSEGYDRIVMNPPFENGQDIDHVQHAFSLLKPGGRLVSIMSMGAFFRQDRKASGFREWLGRGRFKTHEISPDAFKSAFRPTGVSTRMVVIVNE